MSGTINEDVFKSTTTITIFFMTIVRISGHTIPWKLWNRTSATTAEGSRLIVGENGFEDTVKKQDKRYGFVLLKRIYPLI